MLHKIKRIEKINKRETTKKWKIKQWNGFCLWHGQAPLEMANWISPMSTVFNENRTNKACFKSSRVLICVNNCAIWINMARAWNMMNRLIPLLTLECFFSLSLLTMFDRCVNINTHLFQLRVFGDLPLRLKLMISIEGELTLSNA